VGHKSKIEWTDATWNPTTGCTKVSDGCDHCYAHKLAHERLAQHYSRTLPVIQTPENLADPFSIRLWPERLKQPGSWRTPRIVFVNSMSDLFHVDVPESFVRQVFEVMLKVDRHIYQVLTKRPARAVRFFQRNADLFPSGRAPGHIWMGTSVENQDVAYRVSQLRKVPAEIRFLSCEPLLGPVRLDLAGIHWVIAGGESGAEFRVMDEQWALDLRDQCTTQAIPFFFKQWGGRRSKAGGRELGGRTWDEMPIPDRLPQNVAPAITVPGERRRRSRASAAEAVQAAA
jgi:protein gp37